MWGGLAGAAASLAAINEQHRAYEAQKAAYLPLYYSGGRPRKEPIAQVTSKCPCCGSRQFQTHNSVRICSYCRSEQ